MLCRALLNLSGSGLLAGLCVRSSLPAEVSCRSDPTLEHDGLWGGCWRVQPHWSDDPLVFSACCKASLTFIQTGRDMGKETQVLGYVPSRAPSGTSISQAPTLPGTLTLLSCLPLENEHGALTLTAAYLFIISRCVAVCSAGEYVAQGLREGEKKP